MKFDFSYDELVNKVGNKFLLTSVVAKRAIQLKEGDSPLVQIDNVDSIEQPILIAIKEIMDEHIAVGITKIKEITPSQAIFEEEDDFEEDLEEEIEEPKSKKSK